MQDSIFHNLVNILTNLQFQAIKFKITNPIHGQVKIKVIKPKNLKKINLKFMQCKDTISTHTPKLKLSIVPNA